MTTGCWVRTGARFREMAARILATAAAMRLPSRTWRVGLGSLPGICSNASIGSWRRPDSSSASMAPRRRSGRAGRGGAFAGTFWRSFTSRRSLLKRARLGFAWEAVNEVARQVFGFKLGEIYAKDVGSRWVPVKRDDPDAQLFTPQRTRWLGHLGEYLRTGEKRFLYAFGESRKVAKLIDARIDVYIDAFGLSAQPAPSKPRDFESKTSFGSRTPQVRPSQQRPPPGDGLVLCTECGEPQKKLVKGLCVRCDGTLPLGSGRRAPARDAKPRREAPPSLFGPGTFR